jgi:hypothetical protein
MKRARRMSLLLALFALLLLGAGLVAFALGQAESAFLLAGVAGSLGGILTGLTSLIPLIRAWRFNRRQLSDFSQITVPADGR